MTTTRGKLQIVALVGAAVLVLSLAVGLWMNQHSQNSRMAGLQASQAADRDAAAKQQAAVAAADAKTKADALTKAQAEAASAKAENAKQKELEQQKINQAPTVVQVPVPVYPGAPYTSYNPGYNYSPYQFLGVGVPTTTKRNTDIQAEPNTTSGIYVQLPAGTTIDVQCWVTGEPTYGNDKYGSMWLYLTSGGFVHSYQTTGVSVGEC
jgi:FtsZ-interacting cell division protein ZipA